MDHNLKDLIKWVKKMDLVHILGQMALNIKVNGKIIK